MSDSLSLKWFEHLLFGHADPYPPPTEELERLAMRMEAEKLDWFHIMRNGGLTAVPYHVLGDLNMLLEHLEEKKDTTPGKFRTRTVARFWNQLRVLMATTSLLKPAAHVEEEPLMMNDEAILKNMLLGNNRPDTSYKFESATFWGNIARRFLNVRKPLPEVISSPTTDSSRVERLVLLYDVTSHARGESFDPLTMVLVPRSEYLNPVCWQSSSLMETFLKKEPLHPFTRSVQSLVQHSIDEWMEGRRPSALYPPLKPQWENFLHNIQVIHTNIPEVPHQDLPPKLVDVLQRLLAICRRDELWEKSVSVSEPTTNREGMDVFWLMERIQILERENKLLWGNLRDKV